MRLVIVYLLVNMLFLDTYGLFCKNDKITIIKKLENDYNERDKIILFNEIFQFGMEAIPLLIEKIDINKNGIIGFINHFSSNIDNGHFNNFKGIDFAYCVELILNFDKLDSVLIFKYINGDTVFMKNPFHLYDSGIIIFASNIKINGNESEMLSIQDMIKVKAVYKQWWENVKNKSIQEIRNEYKINPPLSKTKYFWK